MINFSSSVPLPFEQSVSMEINSREFDGEEPSPKRHKESTDTQVAVLPGTQVISLPKGLPKELWEQIAIHFLHDDMKSLLRTCKGFRAILLNPTTNAQFIERYINSFDPYLNRIFIKSEGEEWQVIERNEEKIEGGHSHSLSINFGEISKLPLAILELYPCEFISMLTLQSSRFSSKMLQTLFSNFKSLESLCLQDCDFGEMHVSDVLNLFTTPNLKSLVLDDVSVILSLDSNEKEKQIIDDFFEALPFSEIEQMFIYFSCSEEVGEVIKYLIEKILASEKFSSLKSFQTKHRFSNDQIENIIESLNGLEILKLNISNWHSVAKALAASPNGSKIQELFIQTEGLEASEAMEEFAKSEYLKNVKKLIIETPSWCWGEGYVENAFDVNAIQKLSKSEKLKSIEILDIAFCDFNEINPKRPGEYPKLNFSSLLKSNHLKNLKCLEINRFSFSQENLFKVFDKQEFPAFECVKIYPNDEDRQTVEIISSEDELRAFFQKFKI